MPLEGAFTLVRSTGKVWMPPTNSTTCGRSKAAWAKEGGFHQCPGEGKGWGGLPNLGNVVRERRVVLRSHDDMGLSQVLEVEHLHLEEVFQLSDGEAHRDDVLVQVGFTLCPPQAVSGSGSGAARAVERSSGRAVERWNATHR